MLGSRVCWQLLLGWALLLGQPVFGDSGSSSSEERSLQEPEEPVPASEEPEEPEEVLPELEEPGSPEEPEVRELTSDEKLEEDEREERKWVQADLSSPGNFEILDLQRAALEHHHKYNYHYYYYKPFENANLITQKAIGTMIYLQMTVVKTNCTNDLEPKEGESDHSYYYRLYHADRYPRNCEPLSDSEEQIKNCRFNFFEDARNPGEPIFLEHWCIPFHKQFKRDRDISFEDMLNNM